MRSKHEAREEIYFRGFFFLFLYSLDASSNHHHLKSVRTNTRWQPGQKKHNLECAVVGYSTIPIHLETNSGVCFGLGCEVGKCRASHTVGGVRRGRSSYLGESEEARR